MERMKRKERGNGTVGKYVGRGSNDILEVAIYFCFFVAPTRLRKKGGDGKRGDDPCQQLICDGCHHWRPRPTTESWAWDGCDVSFAEPYA